MNDQSNALDPAPIAGVEAASLLSRAEEILARRSGHGTEADHTDTLRLVHQLAVHQIELDLQQQELRHARDQLTESLARYVDLYDFSPAGYLTVDGHSVVEQSNLAAAAMLGLERSRLTKLPLIDFVADADRPRFRDFVERTTELPGEHMCEVNMVSSEGIALRVMLDGRRIDELGRCHLVMVDVTELREAQRAAAEYEALARREEIARMLHDTVLQRLFGVTTSLQALTMDPAMNERSVARIEHLIDELDVTIVNIRKTIFEQRRAWSGDDSGDPADDPDALGAAL